MRQNKGRKPLHLMGKDAHMFVQRVPMHRHHRSHHGAMSFAAQ
jgi:hypothetical protein